MNDIRGAERFLAAFNDIEDHFRRKLGVDHYVSFGELLGTYDKKFRLGQESVRDLRSFAELRNAISHGRYRKGRPIADPRPDVVQALEALHRTILKPLRAYDILPKRPVRVFVPAEPVSVVLQAIREDDYSQFPIYESHTYTGLLTTNCIARWLADRLATEELAEAESIGNVLTFTEPQDRAVHLSAATTAPDAIERLSRSDTNTLPPAALILTHSGKRNEMPLAIVVAADIPALTSTLRRP